MASYSNDEHTTFHHPNVINRLSPRLGLEELNVCFPTLVSLFLPIICNEKCLIKPLEPMNLTLGGVSQAQSNTPGSLLRVNKGKGVMVIFDEEVKHLRTLVEMEII